MTERRLKRALSLPEVFMLGTAGTIAAEIFVLTGHIAGMVGPASVLALLLVGLLSYSLVLNYSELATTFPVTGGAVTYVREAWGVGLLAFLVGSVDVFSSVFYGALSAVGFSYSLLILFPGLPVVPVALVTVAVFTALNVLGITGVGRAQVVLGGLLLALLATYVVVGFTSPAGFSVQTLLPEGRFFIHQGLGPNVARLIGAMALIFNAYVGFEVVAHDAEEVKNPSRNIPLALLISMGVITAIYTTVALVTLGTVPWPQLAGSELALAQAAKVFLPRWGGLLVAVAGSIATLTSVNVAVLSATREALTLSRAGLWPRFMSKLGRRRTPYLSAVVMGGLTAIATLIGLVDFISYVASTGYLFIVFWGTLALMRLRKVRPDLARPFRVPLYPLTPVLGAVMCVVIVLFTAIQPLLLLLALMAGLTVFYYARGPVSRLMESLASTHHEPRGRIMVLVANPSTADGLFAVGMALAQRAPGTVVSALRVLPVRNVRLSERAERLAGRLSQHQSVLFRRAAELAEVSNVPFSTHVRPAPNVWQGIERTVEELGDVRLLLMGWPGPLDAEHLPAHPVTHALQDANADVAVFLNRGLGKLQHILVPFGGSIHARLALRTAIDLAASSGGQVVVLRCLCGEGELDLHDELLLVRETSESELPQVPDNVAIKVIVADSVAEGVLREVRGRHYDLVVMGAAVAASLHTDLFGSLTDSIAQQIPYSVLLVRRYEPQVVNWFRRRVKTMAG